MALSQFTAFKKVVELDLATQNFAIGENVEKNKVFFSKATSAVIARLQNNFDPSEGEQVAAFIKKMQLIDKQFEDAGQGTAFATSIHALSLIHTLRSNLDPTRQEIVKDPFILELRAFVEAETIDDKQTAAQKLHTFQKNVLIPALKSIQSLDELLALQSLVDDCTLLFDKLSSIDKKSALLNQKVLMISQWNLQTCKLDPCYSFLISYKEGTMKNLDKLKGRETKAQKMDAFITNFLSHIDNPEISLSDKIHIYDALKTIRSEFEAYGDGQKIDPILQKLKLAFGIPTSISDSFVIELSALAFAKAVQDKDHVAQRLYAFQNEVLLPALQNVSSREELSALKILFEHCTLLKEKLASCNNYGILEKSYDAMVAIWDTKWVQTETLYPFFVKYQKGQIVDLYDKEKRKIIAMKLQSFIKGFIKVSDQPTIQKDKEAVYKSLCAIHEEFEGYGDAELVEPTLQGLAKVLGLPSTKDKPPISTSEKSITARSTSFSQLRSQFDQNSSPSSSSSSSTTTKTATPVTSPLVNTKTTKTPEEVCAFATRRIQETLASLDLGSPKLRENIKQIKEDLGKLKKLDAINDVDYAALEGTLDILLDPKILRISQEESRFMELVLLSTCKSNADLDKYTNLSAQTVRDACHSLLQNLKQNAASLDSLAKAASAANKKIRLVTIKDRFVRFAEIHPFPTLTQNFASHFPRLVKNFEAFTRDVVAKELENKWGAIVKMYDDRCSGKFSTLLQNYSYMDPRPQFDEFIRISQEKYFESLPLEKIDKANKQTLATNLESILKKHKDYPGKLFESNYMTIFSDMHLWLFENINAIKIPFNQGDDIHKNLGGGVCYHNSLFRFSQILQDPKIAPSQVLMGSNEKTRYCQSKGKVYFDAAKMGTITYEQADDERAKLAEEYGLQQWLKEPVVPPVAADLHDYLVNEMERFALAGEGLFIMGFYPAKGPGHAVNIQIDSANGVYRLYDDNIGLCEYKNLAQFKIQMAKYFKAFYTEFVSYQFRLFQKA